MSDAGPPKAGQTMPEWLHRRANLSPDRLALVCGAERWTFDRLDQQADGVALRLAEIGVTAGDHVATLLSNGPAPVLLLHALARLGAVLVPLNLRLAPAELTWQMGNSGATLLIFAADLEAAAQQAAAQPGVRAVPVATVLGSTAGLASNDDGRGSPSDRLAVGASGPAERGGQTRGPASTATMLRRQVELAAVQGIVYTSGTTGRPRGALLTFGNHWWNAVGSALNLGLLPEDRFLASLPLFHVGGMAILWRSVIYGSAAIVQDRFDPVAMNEAIDSEGVTIVSVVAAMLQRMLDQRGNRPYPPWLRCVLLGGGPAPRPLLEECVARGIPVVQTYGLTETASQAVTLAPEDALRKLGSAGKPLFPLELVIRGTDGPAEPGETGEIFLRGPSVSPGYLGAVAGESAPDQAWLPTGDLGWLDAEGYLYVTDRRDDLIVSGGENVYPAEVEAVLLAHPAVAEAGVTGLPDARWGQVPVAAVVLRSGVRVTATELLAFCTARLARYKVPTRLEFREALPRTASGKLQRRLLWAPEPTTAQA